MICRLSPEKGSLWQPAESSYSNRSCPASGEHSLPSWQTCLCEVEVGAALRHAVEVALRLRQQRRRGRQRRHVL